MLLIVTYKMYERITWFLKVNLLELFLVINIILETTWHIILFMVFILKSVLIVNNNTLGLPLHLNKVSVFVNQY